MRQSASTNLPDDLQGNVGSDIRPPSRLERLRQQAVYQDAKVGRDDVRESHTEGLEPKHLSNVGARHDLARKTKAAVRRIIPGGSPNYRQQKKRPAELAEEAKQHLLSRRYVQAFRSAKRAADLGDPFGMSILGFLYRDGIGVSRDDRKAARWLRRAVGIGDSDAMVGLGRMYAEGRGIRKDDKRALSLFRRAAEHDHADGIYCLALMYWNGWGTRRDVGEALHDFRQAVDRGHINAMNYLALAHSKGIGVAEDAREAAKWYRHAADRGSAHAQFQLGSMHLGGRGVTRDRVRAHAWLSLAAVNGKADAFDVRDRVAELMTPAEVLKARALAVEMQQAHRPGRPSPHP